MENAQEDRESEMETEEINRVPVLGGICGIITFVLWLISNWVCCCHYYLPL